MLTLASIPRGFVEPHYTPQENALNSWTLLNPRPQLILFCNEPGVHAAATRHVCHHEPQIAVSKKEFGGVPLVKAAFRQIEEIAVHNVCCFANADIIFLQDLMRTLARVSRELSQFLLIGKRWELAFPKLHTDWATGWQGRLRERALAEGHIGDHTAYDYFVFTKGALSGLEWLDYQVGSPCWDNWLIGHVHKLGVPIVDATDAIMAIHQFHDKAWPEAGTKENRRLWMKDGCMIGSISEATHTLTAEGLECKGGFKWKA